MRLLPFIIALLAIASPTFAEMTAEDDAAFAVLVFEEQTTRAADLVRKGAITQSEVHDIRMRLLDAQIQQAIAADAKEELVRLLGDRVTLAEESLARIKRLVEKGAATEDDIEDVELIVLSTQVDLAAERGDNQRVVRLLEAQVAAAEKQVNQLRRLYQRRLVTRIELALERLELSRLKNRLADAREQL